MLPFRNLSPDPENEYFSDGITEEIIGTLSEIPGLLVPSRTSCFAFKGKSEDVRRIGDQLGVAAVLEGSVRRAGSRLRVSAQLVDVSSGFQLWSERWDREMADVFAIQDELAKSTADTLKVRLFTASEEPIATPGTSDVEVFNHVLKGRFFFNRRQGREAIREFEAALVRDPRYVEAYTGLADALCIACFYGGLATAEAFDRSRAAAEKALALRPDSFEVHVSLGLIEHYFGWSATRQEEALRTAMRLAPREAAPYTWLAFRGRAEEAVELAETAAGLETHAANVRTNVAWAYAGARRLEEADREYRRALEINADALYPLWSSGLNLQWMGRHAESVAALERAAAISSRLSYVLGVLGGAYAAAGRTEEALGILRELDEPARSEYVAPMHRAFVHIGLLDKDAAFRELERAREERNSLMWWIREAPEYDALRADPRFEGLVSRIDADAERRR